ncbi:MULTISPECIES: ABC transporter permease [Acinetobacter]|uniref:ABC transporter permease n=1 Tax=Acinetobacter TaxID=469 RepID=UPI00141AFBE1|nr:MULTISPECIES: FtsX-like permease family protein [Acinetobacter]MCS4297931.1 putative ABC transport system permease protein [Acinetobacter guillouiae]MCW2251535.1 putative ABC transport system permease protein [Acinetobacter sp. BIGb0204]NII35967.1 putative ABC transport system permease protein [Acinetobacter sp. BIGb0196]
MLTLFKPLFRQSFASSGIYLLIIALSLAISATTALKFSNDQVKQAVTLQAAKMQAADLQLSDTDPIDQQWIKQADDLKLKQSHVTIFGSMASTQDQFVMVNVKAIDTAFPLRGELRIAPKQALQSGGVWLSKRAQELLKLNLGDSVQIANGQFKVTGIIEHDSNQELGFSAFSPTVIISQADVAKTGAIQVGSRIEYRLLMAGDAESIATYQQFFKTFKAQEKQNVNPKIAQNSDADSALSASSANALTENTLTEKQPATHSQTDQSIQDQQNADNELDAQSNLRLRNADEGNSRLLKPIENLDTFLQLANILTILLCGLAIALTSQRYVQQNQDHIALMRCMGATKRQIFQTYLGLLSVVILIAIVIGSILGLILGYSLLQLMLQMIPNLELQFSMLQMLVGPLPIAIFTSAIVLIGFILPSLWQLLNTPPIRVIRQQEKSARSMLWMMATGLVSLIIFSLVLTENLILTALVMGAVIVLTGLLYAVVWMILKTLKSMKNRLSAYIRIPSQTALQITALALGLSLITVLAVLRTDLLERWQQQLPEGTPNQFIYGLPPFELEAFKQQLAQQHWKSTPLYPNVKGRLLAKNGQAFPVQLVKTNNSLRRELNLTQADHYPQDNIIVVGEAQLTQIGQVSVEAKLAEELGIKIGDRLTFSLPEGNLDAQVVNLRTVEWQSFSPNFFFIFTPKTLDENAGSYLGSFYVPPSEKIKMVNLIQQFSNTVFIDVSLIFDEIKNLVSVLVKIITVLAVLVSLSGFLVLIACINLLMDERKKEVALLRSFGSSKRQLKNMMSFEIGFIGLLAGIVSCFFAEVISAVASYRMEMVMQLHWEIWLILPISMAVLCALIGRYRLSYLSEIPPLQSLRELN